jgi:hypothetical protein
LFKRKDVPGDEICRNVKRYLEQVGLNLKERINQWDELLGPESKQKSF